MIAMISTFFATSTQGLSCAANISTNTKTHRTRQGRQGAGIGPPFEPHPLRHGNDPRNGAMQRHRELLPHYREPRTGYAPVHAHRLLRRRLALDGGRIAREHPAGRRHGRRRQIPQDDAGAIRVPPPLRFGQPPDELRGIRVHVPEASALCERHPRRLRTEKDGRRSHRTDQQADRTSGPENRDVPHQGTDGRAAVPHRGSRQERRPSARHDAYQEDGAGPHRLLRGSGHPCALPAQRHQDARTPRTDSRAPHRRIRRIGGHQLVARRPRPARSEHGRDSRRRQGRVPPQLPQPDPDDGTREPQRERHGAPVRRQHDRQSGKGRHRNRPPP